MTKFKFPAELLSQDIAILGRKGSGKTYAAKGMVETLLAHNRRVCIIDPMGVWYGLRSTADGKRAGFPIVVFGGPHADVAINEHSGEALARTLADKNVPAIVDLSEMLIGQRHRFVTDFAEVLYRWNKLPLHLVIDEADEFAPQQPLPETKRMLHQIDRIVRRGRVRGFRVMLITQRPAVLHKNVLTQANTLVAMRLTAPQDRLAVNAWVEGQADKAQAKDVLGTLAGLKRGEGWVWAPELELLERTTFPAITTFDSSRTPEDDETVVVPTRLADVDLTAISASFEAVKHEAETVAELRAELTKLRKAPPNSSVHPATPGVSMDEVQRRIDEAVRAALAETVPRAAHTRLRDAIAGVYTHTREILKGLDIAMQQDAMAHVHTINAAAKAPPAPAPKPTPAPSTAPSKPAGQVNGSGPTLGAELNKAEQRILDSLSWWAAAGQFTPTRIQVAFVARYTENGHFNNTVGLLRGKGLIDYPVGGQIALTSAGRALAAPAPDEAPTYQELVERVTAVLGGEPQRRVFKVLADRPGYTPTRAELAQAAGYTENGHFNNIVGQLNGLGICFYPIKGRVSLSEMFGDLH